MKLLTLLLAAVPAFVNAEDKQEPLPKLTDIERAFQCGKLEGIREYMIELSNVSGGLLTGGDAFKRIEQLKKEYKCASVKRQAQPKPAASK